MLNKRRIDQLVVRGHTWDEIGRKIAKEYGRRMPYSGSAVIKVYNGQRRVDQARKELVKILIGQTAH